jgi:hypothetical protein
LSVYERLKRNRA